jgi:hypothetical protein
VNEDLAVQHDMWQQIVASVLICLMVTAVACRKVERPKVTAEKTSTRVVADLKAEVLAPLEDLRIAVTLSNTGSVPFQVDRDLVLGLRVFCPDVDLPADRWEHVERRPRLDEQAAASRFMVLSPGKSLTREIALRTGFAVFWHDEVLYTDGSEGVVAHEYVVRLPERSHPHHLTIGYSLELEDPGAIWEYTGRDLDALGPFPQRLTVAVTF